jgi:hypothetical protein
MVFFGDLLLVALPAMLLYFTCICAVYVRHHVYSLFIYLAYIASPGLVYIVFDSSLYNAKSSSAL